MNFRHKTPIQIRFKDIDALGHVNNANHLSYLESARISYFMDVIGSNINWAQKGIILAKAILDYRNPIFLNDEIFVETKCSRIGNKSFDLSYSIVKMENEKIVVLLNATTVMVCFDYEIKQTIGIPEEWKEKIMEFEGDF